MKNIKAYNYSVNNAIILKFVTLFNNMQINDNRANDLFDRTRNVNEKYIILFKQLREDQKNFDILVNILEKNGNLDAYIIKNGPKFYSISHSNKNITAYSRKLRQAFADYINSIAEFLEILRYLFAKKYNENPKDNFKSFIQSNKNIMACDINYFKIFYKDVWNKQKHVKNLTITSFKFANNIISLPKINNKEVEFFSNELLEKIIEIIKLNL
jgi:hypothetical protein